MMSRFKFREVIKALPLQYKTVRRVKIPAVVMLLVASLSGACSDGGEGSAQSSEARDYAVGITMRNFVDTTRSTAAHSTLPEVSNRTIETTIVYPAQGTPGDEVVLDADVYEFDVPFPLVVLGHGLGGSVGSLLSLAQSWASRGYVVALPAFPLTNSATPGGPVQQDTQNQPADVSFVIDEIIAEGASSGALLSNAIDEQRLAAGGHSNGGVTTYGIALHTCCRDQRLDAAIVLSGAPGPYSGGEYDPSIAPPMMVIHGVNDILLSYNGTVRFYNQLLPPKSFLTLEEYDHSSYLFQDDPAFEVVAQSTGDFLDGILRDDREALEQLPEEYQVPGLATIYWAPDEASNVEVETAPEPETNRQAFLSADSELTDGQVITVTWSGYLPGGTVNIIQCVEGNTSSAGCNISGGKVLFPNPLGSGSTELTVRTGPTGDGVCDRSNPCAIIVNDSGLTEEGSSVRIPITFAG